MSSYVSGYRVVERVPPVEDYLRVRGAAGLSEKGTEAAWIGLSNTVHGVCAERDGEVVGFGRIVEDGARFFEVWTSPWCRSIRDEGSERESWTC